MTAEAIGAAMFAQISAGLGVAGAEVLDDDTGIGTEALGEAGAVSIMLQDRGVIDEINGNGPFSRTSIFEIEVQVQGVDATERRSKMRALLDGIEAALLADRSLSGNALDLEIEAAEPDRIPIAGGEDVLTEVVLVSVEYTSDSRL